MYKTDELRTARIDSLVTPQALADKLPIRRPSPIT